MIQYKRVTQKQELEQILQLQLENLPASVSEEIQKKEGFVTVHHDLAILRRMNEACPHIIATIGQQVIGYALCMHPKFSDEIAVLKPMFKKIHEELGTAASFIAMGQICVQAGYRGQGIFRGLYTYMRTVLQAEFNRIITEVDVKNTRSLQAHYAVGFEKLIAYEADGHQWELIQLKI